MTDARGQPRSAPGPDLLRAPWRDAYMQALNEARLAEDANAPTFAEAERTPACADAASFFSDYWRHPEQDEANHVVLRLGVGATGGMVVLNRYPYANGHLLVALGEGRPRLLDYSPAQRAAFWRLVEIAWALMDEALAPQGINMGINEGAAAGAGVPQHLHAHLVPRWAGDVNFITVAGDVRVIPSALEAMAERYRAAWSRLQAQIEDAEGSP